MKTKIDIDGMHCASCEILLEKELKKIDGISNCEVSHKKGSLEVECDGEIPIRSIKKSVYKCGYKVVKDGEEKQNVKKKSLEDYIQLAMIFLAMGVFAYALMQMDFAKYFPEVSENMSVIVALLLGVVASFSTCLILVGGVVMSFGSMYKVNEEGKNRLMSRALPHIYFHIGRIGGFAILGGLLGLLGSKINYSLSFTGYLTMIVGVVMLYIGLQIVGLLPSITKLGFHLPKSWSKSLTTMQESNHPLAPIILGVLTFLLPCGFTQSMQIAAIGSQSFVTGSLIMGAFALGTLPALFSLGLGSSYAQRFKFGLVKNIIGVVVVFFGLYSINSGLVLSGAGFNFDMSSSENAMVSTLKDDVQLINMDVDWGFSPDEFVIKKGVPVRWEINGINVSGCSNEIVIPKLGISKKINDGLNVIEFTPEEVGTLPFSCWMGMIGGTFIVEE